MNMSENNDRTITTLLIFLLCIKFTNTWNYNQLKSWKYNPVCLLSECCNDDNIVHDVDKLRNTIRSKVYGQHLVNTAIDAIWSHIHYKSPKPLTLSFHGWPGGGKNYVSSFIAESLYKEGLRSEFVHTFIGRVHFPEKSQSGKYRDNLYLWLKGNLSYCPKQLFIFDEVDKMPPTVLNAIKPMIDYRSIVDGIDYTQAIFIFLSNTGAEVINEHYHTLWSQGRKREEMKLSDFETLISRGAFNEIGGFHRSDAIKANLIDHYIPFLPLLENHVRECIKDQFRERGVGSPKQEHILEVMEFVEWGPKETKLFSKTGCKRISSKVAVIVAQHYPKRKKSEL